MRFEAVKCECGQRGCKSWWVEPVAAVQGVSFDEAQARAVAALLNGNQWVMEEDLCAGDRVRVSGFTCVTDGDVLVVESLIGGLCVPCRHGMHYLSGQLNDEGRLVGVEKVDRILNERKPA